MQIEHRFYTLPQSCSRGWDTGGSRMSSFKGFLVRHEEEIGKPLETGCCCAQWGSWASKLLSPQDPGRGQEGSQVTFKTLWGLSESFRLKQSVAKYFFSNQLANSYWKNTLASALLTCDFPEFCFLFITVHGKTSIVKMKEYGNINRK